MFSIAAEPLRRAHRCCEGTLSSLVRLPMRSVVMASRPSVDESGCQQHGLAAWYDLV